MKIRIGLWMSGAALILAGLIAGPALAQGDPVEHYRQRHEILIKELNLPADKYKELQAVEEKYIKERKALYADMKKYQDELTKAMAAPTPDEKKIKELVTAVTSTQDKMFNTFRAQRDADLALMTPVQQGRYLNLLHKWREEMMQEHMKSKQK